MNTGLGSMIKYMFLALTSMIAIGVICATILLGANISQTIAISILLIPFMLVYILTLALSLDNLFLLIKRRNQIIMSIKSIR